MYAATTGEHAARSRLGRAQRVGNARRADFEQRRLHVLDALVPAQARLQPPQVELLAAAALRRRQREPGFVEQARQQRVIDAPFPRERAIGVERSAGVQLAPRIEQRIGRVISPGATYTSLDRLEERGFVASWIGETAPARGGRRRKYYRLSAAGARALERSYADLSTMAAGLLPTLRQIAAGGKP